MQTTLYRIYTEDTGHIGEHNIISALRLEGIESFTILHGAGYRQSTEENSTIVEITSAKRAQIDNAAERIRETNAQQAVLILAFGCESTLITADEKQYSGAV